MSRLKTDPWPTLESRSRISASQSSTSSLNSLLKSRRSRRMSNKRKSNRKVATIENRRRRNIRGRRRNWKRFIETLLKNWKFRRLPGENQIPETRRIPSDENLWCRWKQKAAWIGWTRSESRWVPAESEEASRRRSREESCQSRVFHSLTPSIIIIPGPRETSSDFRNARSLQTSASWKSEDGDRGQEFRRRFEEW